MLLQFAHGREQLPSPIANVSSGGTTTISRSLYFILQGQNVAGYNLPSQLIGPITIGVGQKLELTLPSTIRALGEFFSDFVISASTSTTLSTFSQIARIRAHDSGGASIALPTTLTFSTDEQLALSKVVATPAALPFLSLTPGMRRGVEKDNSNNVLAYVFEYDPLNTTLSDNVATLDASPAPGRWSRVGGFSTIVSSVSDPYDIGCARDVRSINPSSLKVPSYACNGQNGPGFRFWLTNNSDEEIPSGLRIMINVKLGENPATALFEGLLRVVFRGYVNTLDGTLRTTTADGDLMFGLNQEVLFENKKTDLLLQDNLLPYEAFALDIYPNLRPEFLNNEVVNQSLVGVLVGLALQAGAYVEGATGNKIYAEYNRGLVVPQRIGVKCLKRSGRVNSRSFRSRGESVIVGLHPNTTQPVYINSDGFVYTKTEAQNETEAIRAIVSNLSGVSAPCAWSDPITLTDLSGIDVTCNYPSNGVRGVIRSDYPDPLLIGNSQGQFNCQILVLYVRSTVAGVSTIKKFPGRLIVDGATQLFQLSDWASGTTISSVPDAPTPNFCLFAPLSADVVGDGVGDFPIGTIEVAFAYELDGTTISSISHSRLDGCLLTSTLDDADIEEAVQYWAPGVATKVVLRAVPLAKVVAYQARYVVEVNNPYHYDPLCTLDDDDYSTLKPDGKVSGDPGRWILDDSNAIHLLMAAPTALTHGEIGDIAIVVNLMSGDAGNLYEKTAPLVWTLRGSIRGPKGDPGVRPRGAWDSDADYIVGDLVRRSGGGYVSIAPSTNVDPATDTLETKWQLYAAKGEDGIDGDPGGIGPKGDTGSAESAGGLIIEEGAPLATTVTQLALRNDGGVLKVRDENNGQESTIATLEKDQTYSKAQRSLPATLTIASGEVELDATASNLFRLELTEDCIIQAPINLLPGANFEIRLVQDSGGNHIPVFDDAYLFPGGIDPLFSIAGGARDRVFCSYDGLTLECDCGRGYS